MPPDRERIRLYEISRRVGEVMHDLWDPIGVSQEPYARDEYDAYVPVVTGMLMRGAGENEIASYLTRTSTETMGLSGTSVGRSHDEKIAKLLVQHFQAVDAQYERG